MGVLTMKKHEEEAKTMKKAIVTMANNEESLDNFINYLSCHFDEWIEKYANCSEKMASEFKRFSEI